MGNSRARRRPPATTVRPPQRGPGSRGLAGTGGRGIVLWSSSDRPRRAPDLATVSEPRCSRTTCRRCCWSSGTRAGSRTRRSPASTCPSAPARRNCPQWAPVRLGRADRWFLGDERKPEQVATRQLGPHDLPSLPGRTERSSRPYEDGSRRFHRHVIEAGGACVLQPLPSDQDITASTAEGAAALARPGRPRGCSTADADRPGRGGLGKVQPGAEDQEFLAGVRCQHQVEPVLRCVGLTTPDL